MGLILWKIIDGHLIHTTDESRIKFRTNISKSILQQLDELAEKHDTHINYLLESGLKKLLIEDTINFNKKTRPKDRVQYKTTYDKELLEAVRQFATQHDLFINDVIEYSVNLIDIKEIKNRSYKHRAEMW